MENSHVLACVDGSEGGRAALQYGAAEAGRWGIDLRVLHVWPGLVPPAGTYSVLYPGSLADGETIGRQILEEHAQQARMLLPAERVSTSLMSGDRLTCLVRAANDARLTVLGDERRPIVDRLATGTVLAGVAARAVTPVVAVPASWSPAPGKEGVVAAVKSTTDSTGFVYRAMQIAAEHHLPVTLLHAWQLPMVYDDYIATRIGEDVWHRQTAEQLDALVDAVRADFPAHLSVRTQVRHGQPARAIVDASASADLVLLARRRHSFPLGHLGGTARAVLREGLCPIEVLPAGSEPDGAAGLVLEAEGAMVKGLEGS